MQTKPPRRTADAKPRGHDASPPKTYTPEQRAADAKRWAAEDAEDDAEGWEHRRRRIGRAYAEH
jgi:hypothetical protein